jgi:hypothetical protein
VRFVDVEVEVRGIVTGVRYPEFPTVDVLAGAEGMEVILPEVVEFVIVLLDVDVEFDKYIVVKCPPKYRLDPSEFGDIVSTAPFNPPNGTGIHDELEVDQSATFPVDPETASNSPPAQTCPFALSQYSVCTDPDNPLDSVVKVPLVISYEAMFVDVVDPMNVNEPPI